MEKEVSRDFRSILCLILGVVFCAISYIPFSVGEIVAAVLIFICGIVTVIVGYFAPYKYSFDFDGVTISYFGKREQSFPWKNINCIICEEKTTSKGGKYYEYKILGTPFEATPKYMKGVVYKTSKTESMFLKYAEDKLVDFTAIPKFKKSSDDITKYIYDLEMLAKHNVEKYMSHYYNELSVLGLELKIRFAYFLNDDDTYKEFSARPEGDTSYAAVIEISRPDEQDPKKIFRDYVDLVEVEQDKKRKKYIYPDTVLWMLSITDEGIEEIKNRGFEEFMADESVEEE